MRLSILDSASYPSTAFLVIQSNSIDVQKPLGFALHRDDIGWRLQHVLSDQREPFPLGLLHASHFDMRVWESLNPTDLALDNGPSIDLVKGYSGGAIFSDSNRVLLLTGWVGEFAMKLGFERANHTYSFQERHVLQSTDPVYKQSIH